MENPIVDEGGLADRYQSQALSVLRIVTALLFLVHGSSKIFGVPMSSASFPAAWTLLWVAGMMELIGGLLLLVGLFSRPVALLLSGEMAVAYWMVHAPEGAFPILNGGEAAVLFCFVFFYIAFAGPGTWSVDAWWRGKKRAAGPDGYYAGLHGHPQDS